MLGCKPSPPTTHDLFGIYFSIPGNWNVTDQEKINETDFYLSIEKNGINSSGLISVSTYPNDGTPEQILKAYQQAFKQQKIYKNSDILFHRIEKVIFGQYESNKSRFNRSILGLKHMGSINLIQHNDKNYIILIQEAVEDMSKNDTGFRMFEESFLIE